MTELELTIESENLVAKLAGVQIFTYVIDTSHVPAQDTPKPYFHPVRTLSGEVVTDFAPEDHPWHHGITVAFPRVNDHNLWGGGTYLGPDSGYVVQSDHGEIKHHKWLTINAAAGTFSHELGWYGQNNELLLTETRSWKVNAINHGGNKGWQLELHTSFRNELATDISLETPQQRGRADGGYGGLFFRMSADLTDFNLFVNGDPSRGSGDEGHDLVIQAQTSEGEEATIAMEYQNGIPVERQKWLYRVTPFPLAGFAVAYDEGLVIPVGESFAFSHRIGVLDGIVDSESAIAALNSEV